MQRRRLVRSLPFAAVATGLLLASLATAAGPESSASERMTTIFLPGLSPGTEAAKKPDEKKDELKPFEELVQNMEKIEGLFTFYRNTEENKVLVELRPEQFDRDYIYSAKIEQGTGEKGIYGTIMIDQFIFQWRRLGKRVQFVQKNTRFRAASGSPVERAVANSFTDSVLASGKILSKPHPEHKGLLVDLSDIFISSDLHGVAQYLKEIYKTGYKFDKDDSGFVLVKSFPKNSEIGTVAHFQAQEYGKEFSTAVPDMRAINLRFRYSLVALPENDYRPRLADDRVGHFLTVYQDLSSPVAEVPYVRLVERWHLKKKEPKAAVSEPVAPIVFWLENSIPVEFRKSIADGILLWNRAFEKAGFRNVIVVKQQPDDAEWDPADIRYNTIRWFAGYDASFAIGPSHVNPYTGQIIDADIGISDGIIRFPRAAYREFVSPVENWAEAEAWLRGDLPRAPWMRDPSRLCDFGQEGAAQAALGYEILEARGESGEREEEFMRQWILDLMAHEVGHTLGLRHNFRASTINTLEQLHDRKRTQHVGVGASVMDYNPPSIAPKGTPQGDYYMTNIGSYDEWAIEYAYKPIPGAKTPKEELPELQKIAARGTDPLLPYNTDEDSWFFPRSIDPLTGPWDLGSDNLAYFAKQIGLVQELFSNMEAKLEKPGESYEILRRSFNRMQSQYIFAGLGASKYIGGIYHHRDHVADPNARLPFVPVPAARQREALDFLALRLWAPDAFAVPAQLLNKLALKRFYDFDFNTWRAPRIDYPLHAVALNIQRLPLLRLYHPITLSRVQDLELKVEKPSDRFTLADLFVGLRDAIWSELGAETSINSFRRNLQRAHLNQLIQLMLRPEEETPEDAITLARADLVELRKRIERQLGSASRLDYTTRAHLEETGARIGQALEAQLQRGF